MIRAYRLFTGPDGKSHVMRGTVNATELVDAQSILFKETPCSSSDRHKDPIPHYVLSLAGVVEFTSVDGEAFIFHPGDILLVDSGSSYKWRLIDAQPWKRAYVVFKEGADTQFTPTLR